MEKRALLIIDVQNVLANKKGLLYHAGNEEVIEKINSLIKEFHDNHEPIISCALQFTPEMINNLRKKNKVQEWQESLLPEAWGSKFAYNSEYTDLFIYKSEQLFESETSAFYSKDHSKKNSPLNSYLKSEGVTELVICGISTDVGVSSAAKDANDLGYDVVIKLGHSNGRSNEVRLYQKNHKYFKM